MSLKASKTYKNKFERGQIDEFTLEAVDLGHLKKIKTGHDNKGRAGWHATAFLAPLGACI